MWKCLGGFRRSQLLASPLRLALKSRSQIRQHYGYKRCRYLGQDRLCAYNLAKTEIWFGYILRTGPIELQTYESVNTFPCTSPQTSNTPTQPSVECTKASLQLQRDVKQLNDRQRYCCSKQFIRQKCKKGHAPGTSAVPSWLPWLCTCTTHSRIHQKVDPNKPS